MEPTAPSQRMWSLGGADVAAALNVDPGDGLSTAEAAARREQFGSNELRKAAARGPLAVFLSQFADFMIGLLCAAAVVSATIGEWTDAILIGLIVLANAVIGFVQEWKAEQAVEALKKLSQPICKVRRNGALDELPATELVPGDVVELAAGDFVPADGRLLSASNLQVEEAALTGESLPVDKQSKPVAPEARLPERTSMAFAGTAATRGHGRLLITATGMSTELGHIATLLETTEATQTPLQRRLASLGRRLAVAVILIAIFVFALGVLREDRSDWNTELFSRMLLVAVSLAVAAIPEGLPAVITIALARGSQRMAARNAIIRRLAAVETLGSVDVICSDKTGTLTENRMVVRDVIPADGQADDSKLVSADSESAAALELLKAGVLCNDAELDEAGQPVGSATETAFVAAIVERGIDPAELRSTAPRLDEIPFDSATKRMATLHRLADGGNRVYVKGAAEVIVQLCRTLGTASQPLEDGVREHWLAAAEELAERGYRMLAVAEGDWDGDSLQGFDDSAPLRLLGLVGIVDPPREVAAASIAKCRSAGIRPVMITGDHPGTARTIASELDIYREGDEVVTGPQLDEMSDAELNELAPRTAVYARVTPEYKLRIVQAHQHNGSVAAMTGDGVNDAPALKQADIGLAMGITGTDVAKEAAEMVLADDNFATIVGAVEEGRTVYDNIRKFVRYLLTANAGEVFVLTAAMMLGLPLPLLPVHILWINLVTDGLPALALGYEPSEEKVMHRPPRRRDESIFADGLAWNILWLGLLMAASCLGLFWLCLEGVLVPPLPGGKIEAAQYRDQYAQTLVFLTLSMFQLFYVFALRSTTQSFFSQGVFGNPRLIGAVAIGTVMQFVVVYVPAFQPYFHTVPLSAPHLLLALVVSTLAFGAVEVQKAIGRARSG